MQHKEGRFEGFTADYGCKRLLYFEGYEDICIAIAREKQLKGWRRQKKLNLIRAINPEFTDLAQTWGWQMIKDVPLTFKSALQQDPLLWFWWPESSDQHRPNEHPRGPSTARHKPSLKQQICEALRSG